MKIQIELSPKFVIFTTILIFGLFRPVCFSDLSATVGGTWSIINNLYLIWGAFDYLCILFLSFIYLRSFPAIIIPVALMRIVIIVNDLRFDIPVGDDIQALGMHVCSILLISIYVELEKEEYLFKVIEAVLACYIIINLATILLYMPNGFYINTRGWPWNYFLGYKNSHIYFFLPYALFVSVLDIIRYNMLKVKHKIMLILICLSAILSNASTGTVVMITVLLCVLLVEKFGLSKLITMNRIIFLSLILSIGMIMFDIQMLFGGFISSVFQKDTTFTKRVSVWHSAIYGIMNHPVFGNGSKEIISITRDIGNMGHAHNMYLDIMYIGGIVCLIMFLIISLIAGRKVDLTENIMLRNFMTIISIGYFVLFLMEANRTNASFYLFLGICFNLDRITDHMAFGEGNKV